MHRYLYFFSLIFFTFITFVSCESDFLEGEWSKTPPVKNHFSLDKQKLDFGFAAASESVTVTTNGSWSASADASWIKLSPASGNADSQLSISIEENNTESDRFGEIIVKSQPLNSTSKIVVAQKGKNFNFTVDKDSIGSSSVAFSDLITITTNDEWTIAADKDWLSLSVSSGKGEGNVNINVLENKTPEARIAMISIKGKNSGTTASVKVVQDGKFLKVYANSLNFSNDGESKTVIISTDGTYSVSQEGEWFIVSQIGDTLTVTAEKNIATSMNSGSIVVSMTNLTTGSLSQTISVKQGATDYNFSVDKTSITSDYSANSTLFTITTNDEWTITTSDSWITVSSSSGSGDRDITVNLSENTTTTSRSGSITISGKNSGESATITVLQVGKKEVVNADGYENGYAYVDLGLPSGTLWATCNIGAESPDEFGDYFAWGETEPKRSYDWRNYVYSNGSATTLTKYCISVSYGTIDNKSILDPEDDAAHAKWGGSWRMPTKIEQDELREECTWTWTTFNGVKGYLVTSKKNSKYIFIPAAGGINENGIFSEEIGLYWSSIINTEVPYQACALDVSSRNVAWNNVSSRSYGYPVRPVFKDFETCFLNVDKSMVSIDCNSTRAIIELSTNDSWTVSSDVSWITLSAASGRGDNLLFISASENTSSSSRSGIVTIVGSNSTTKTVTVYQDAQQEDINSWDERDVVHEYVDLGLSSGVLWATCNVGAKTSEGYGEYFAWGEIKPKSSYSWATYKHCIGSEVLMTKYCTDRSLGEVDNKTILDLDDDAAHVLWGGNWRMPTNAEMEELAAECTWTWKTQSGINGYLVSSKQNGNSIFLPAADCLADSYYNCAGSNGMYWTSSLETTYSVSAFHFCFYSDNRYFPESGPRYVGCTIRPVCKQKEASYSLSIDETSISVDSSSSSKSFNISSNDSWTISTADSWISVSEISGNGNKKITVTISANTSSSSREGKITINGTNSGSKTILVTQEGKPESGNNGYGYENGYEYVDLGLPSGLLWATCNVGATNPEDYGDYFAWGETETKITYDWSTYKYGNGSSDILTKYNHNSSYGIVDNKTVLDLEDDVAHVKWGGSWRMPTKTEQDEIRDENNCTWTWTTQNGVKGYQVMSKKNSNSIFLPAAGYYTNDFFIRNAGTNGFYWSSTKETNNPYSACSLPFNSFEVLWSNIYLRCSGQSVRPICIPSE